MRKIRATRLSRPPQNRWRGSRGKGKGMIDGRREAAGKARPLAALLRARANSLMVRSGDFLRVPFFLRKNGHESIDSLYTLREFALAGWDYRAFAVGWFEGVVFSGEVRGGLGNYFLPGLRVGMVKTCRAFYHREMSETAEQDSIGTATHASKYTRNNPYSSTVIYNRLLTGEGSEKETRHVELSIEEGMTYTPGDAVGILPENRPEAVSEALTALGFTGDERVLDHYKVEISLEEALRTRLQIGKMARSSVNQLAKLAPEHEGLKLMAGPENKARAEEYCWGRELVDLVTDFPGVIKVPQQLFQVVARLTP